MTGAADVQRLRNPFAEYAKSGGPRASDWCIWEALRGYEDGLTLKEISCYIRNSQLLKLGKRSDILVRPPVFQQLPLHRISLKASNNSC